MFGRHVLQSECDCFPVLLRVGITPPLTQPSHGTCLLLLQTHNSQGTDFMQLNDRGGKKTGRRPHCACRACSSSYYLIECCLSLAFSMNAQWLVEYRSYNNAPLFLFLQDVTQVSEAVVEWNRFNVLCSQNTAVWLHERNPEGSWIITSDWSFQSSRLLQHVPMHSRVHPLLHARF